jgi:hypothetical protein
MTDLPVMTIPLAQVPVSKKWGAGPAYGRHRSSMRRKRSSRLSRREHMEQLGKENRELRRANEILRAAAVVFGRSSTATARDDRLHRRAPRGIRGRADL